MKIMLVGTCLGVGGAERVMVDLADAYASLGHEVRLIALKEPNHLSPRNPNVNVKCFKTKRFIGVAATAKKLRDEITDFHPDVVHAHLFHAIILTRLIRLVVSIPRLVTTVHSTHVGGFVRRWAYRWTDSLSDVSTSVSQEVARSFRAQNAVGTRKMDVVYNGTSLDHFRKMENARNEVAKEFSLDQKTSVIVSVGRLEAAKDYPNLLSALALIKTQEVPFLALVVGEGSLRHALKEAVNRLNLSHCVFFLGIRHDICRLLSAADVFVLSSAWEGLPMAVGEAMACECTIVATDCGGVRELVADTGILVPPSNPKLLATNIISALSLSIVERKKIGARAHQRVHNFFSLEASVTHWMEIYGQSK